MLKGFRDFILRGNVLDLAVGVVIGAAFGAVVTSFTKDVLMQAISAIVGKPDFKDVVWSLNGTPIYVGNFFTALMSCINTSFVNEVTTAPNDAPITTPTARSSTLPRRMNSRNPLSICTPH